MVNPKDLYKILVENQKYIEDEYKKACEKVLEEAQDILICPYQLYTIHRKANSTG